MKTDLLTTTDTANTSSLFVRTVVALVILPHGLQKLVGSFGGYGFNGTMDYFTNDVGMPWIFGFLVILLETFGMVLLLAGLLSRLVAGSLIVVMIGAAYQHRQNGFFMNWFGNQAGEGVEFFILAVSLSLLIVVQGAGKWSVDRWLSTKMRTVRAEERRYASYFTHHTG